MSNSDKYLNTVNKPDKNVSSDIWIRELETFDQLPIQKKCYEEYLRTKSPQCDKVSRVSSNFDEHEQFKRCPIVYDLSNNNKYNVHFKQNRIRFFDVDHILKYDSVLLEDCPEMANSMVLWATGAAHVRSYFYRLVARLFEVLN